MKVWTVTILDDEDPIVRVYSSEDKARKAEAEAWNYLGVEEVIVQEQEVR